MNDKPYDIIIADPPWQYDGKTALSKTAGEHYQVAYSTNFNNLPLKNIAAKDSLLFMWCSGCLMKQAIELMEAWGWTFKQVAFVWDKKRVNPGSYSMTACEFVIVGKRGKIPQPRGVRNTRQLLSELRGKHSVKPEQVMKSLCAMFPTQNKLELFARRDCEGWDTTGNELDGKDVYEFCRQKEEKLNE
tara:strand:+ start:1649 stop:2212 length:564 start_codon:yes stop_codon:yes gene_type:complete